VDVRDKVTIITGASAGIGLATARRFATEGAKVVLAARSVDKLRQVESDLRGRGSEALAIPTDVRNRFDVVRMVDQTYRTYDRIDILINNAGQAAAGRVVDISEGDFRQIIDLNIFGVLYAIQAVVPKMRPGGGGLIMNVSSMVSKMSIPGLGSYASTKAALNVLSATARVELGADNIRVITIFPRTTDTDFGRNSLGDRAMRQRQRAHSSVPVDSPDVVAERILEAARTEPAELYVQG
jgi:NADP-dependent 3-hydroxy acid dehydrogenase YdfG